MFNVIVSRDINWRNFPSQIIFHEKKISPLKLFFSRIKFLKLFLLRNPFLKLFSQEIYLKNFPSQIFFFEKKISQFKKNFSRNGLRFSRIFFSEINNTHELILKRSCSEISWRSRSAIHTISRIEIFIRSHYEILHRDL